VALFYAWSTAEAQATGTGGEVCPSTPDRQAGGPKAGRGPPDKRGLLLEVARRLGTLDPVRVWQKDDN